MVPMMRLSPVVGADGAGRRFSAAIVAGGRIPFAGGVAAVLKSVRAAWMKIYGACLATISPGSVRTVVNSMGSVISEDSRRRLPRPEAIKSGYLNQVDKSVRYGFTWVVMI